MRPLHLWVGPSVPAGGTLSSKGCRERNVSVGVDHGAGVDQFGFVADPRVSSSPGDGRAAPRSNRFSHVGGQSGTRLGGGRVTGRVSRSANCQAWASEP